MLNVERFKKRHRPVEKENKDIGGMLAKCFQAKSTIGWVEGPYVLSKSWRTELIMETLIVEHVRQYFESLWRLAWKLTNFVKPSAIFKFENVMHYDCERTIQQQSDDVKDTSAVNTYGTVDNQIANTMKVSVKLTYKWKHKL